MFPYLTAPPVNPLGAALSGYTEGANAIQNMRQQAEATNQAKALTIQQQALAALQNAKAANAVPLAAAELQQAQAIPGLTKAQTQEALAGAGLKSSQAGLFNTQNQLARITIPSEQAKATLLTKYPGLGLQGPAALIDSMRWVQGLEQQEKASGTKGPATNYFGDSNHIELPSGQGQQAVPQMSSVPAVNFNPETGAAAQIPALPNHIAAFQNDPSVSPTPIKSPVTGNPTFLPPQTDNMDLMKILKSSLLAPYAKDMAIAAYDNKRAQIANWQSLPPAQKQANLAQVIGFGYDPQQAQQLLIDGNRIDDLADAKGYGRDPANYPPPMNPAQPGIIAGIQKRMGSSAELNTINPWIDKSLRDYFPTWGKTSPKQVIEAATNIFQTDPTLKNATDEKQANFLAAAAVLPDLTAIRGRVAGAEVGVTVMENMADHALLNIMPFKPLVTPKVWSMSQKLLDKHLIDAINNANRAQLNPQYGNKMMQEASGNTETQNKADPLGLRKYVK